MLKRETKTRCGFILVVTLMLLAIAAVALAVVGRSSMGLAVSAVRARQDVQRRWGSYSSRHAVLELAPLLLEDAEEDAGEPVVNVRTEIQLSGLAYSLTVSEEQAKANVNAMLQHLGLDAVRTFVRRQFTEDMGASEIFLPTNHKPSSVQDADGAVEPDRRIISLNHLMPDFDPDSYDRADGYPVDSLTCWGDGRINFSRAPDERVQEIIKPLLGAIQIDRLRETLTSSESMSLAEAITGIGVSEDDVSAVMERLTLESSCYSAWVAVDNGKRHWHELSVLEWESGDDARNIQPGEADDPGDVESTVPVGVQAPSVFPGGPGTDGLESTDQKQEQGLTPPQTQDDGGTYPRLYVYQW